MYADINSHVVQIAVPFIGLTALAWLLIVVGYGIGTNGFQFDESQPYSYPYWMACISGPFVIVTAVLHAALWKPISNIMGAVVSSVICLTP